MRQTSAIIAAPLRPLTGRPPALPATALARLPLNLPASLAFLSVYGVDPLLLLTAAEEARAQAVAPEAALLASGNLQERFFYQCLADHLGAAFVEGDAALAAEARYPLSIHSGIAPLEGAEGRRWLAAPRGAMLAELLARAQQGESFSADLAITTPAHMSRLVRARAVSTVLWEASLGLANLDPSLSAKAGASRAQCAFAMVAVGAASFAFGMAPVTALTIVSLSMTCFFLASIWLRLFAGAASTASIQEPYRPDVGDRWLPIYSVVVALHKEARVVPQLVAALDAIDYPRGKLDIKLVIEHDDHATRLAIEALNLPPTYETIVAPEGWPRTKPRALNIALPLARGELLVIFDAEDMPAPGQLRQAAERFLRAPRELACLQAWLAIDNIEDSWLTRLFAIEYAVLFDVLNPGLAGLGLPLPLGGSSNHFRTSVLREICGWDAWNVTEDADLGLRLARQGYRVDILRSCTQEEAPARLDAWLTQRRRWSKGWMQTFITLTRDPRRVALELGAANAVALVLTLTGLVIAPPLWPFFAALAVHDLHAGLPAPESALPLVETVLWMSAALFGAGSILWLALLGMKRRKLLGLWPFLPLMFVYYLMTSAAAWLALYDLILRPYHWHKTEHGLAKTSRQAVLSIAARAAAAKAGLL